MRTLLYWKCSHEIERSLVNWKSNVIIIYINTKLQLFGCSKYNVSCFKTGIMIEVWFEQIHKMLHNLCVKPAECIHVQVHEYTFKYVGQKVNDISGHSLCMCVLVNYCKDRVT